MRSQQISVESMPLSRYLPSNSVQRIFQDKEGFIWLGTRDGLCRYDAYNMLIFRSGVRNSSILTDNDITCITEDNDNNLFIGTKKGVNILNKETYRITPMEHKEIKEQEIRSILIDSEGYIWIGTLSWVYRFSPDLSSWKKFDHELPITSVNSIFEDTNKNIWISLWSEGLHKYDSRKNTFVRQPKIGERDNPFKFFCDNKGRYWLCTWGDGLYRFYPNNEQQTYKPVEIISPFHKQNKEDVYFSITQDQKYGYIWLMSTSGVSAFSCDDNNNIVEIDISSSFKNYNNIFSELVSDKDGNLWVAAFSEGALTINLEKPIVRNYVISSIKETTGFSTNIGAIYKDDEGELWINQNRWGFGLFSPQKNKIRFYHEFPSLKDLPGINFITCIADLKPINQEILLAPVSEPYIYSVKKQGGIPVLTNIFKLNNITDKPGRPRLFFKDRDHNMWIATTTCLLVKPKGKDTIEKTQFCISGITGITEDNEKKLWISTKNSGIYKLSIEGLKNGSGKAEHLSAENKSLISDNIETICSDATGNIYIGSKEGHIFIYKWREKVIENLSDRFDLLHEGIQNITIDNIGHVWISTNKEIIEYNPENQGSMVYLSNNESIISSFFYNSLYNDGTGNLFYGGNKGISVFSPYNKLSEEPQRIKAVITNLKINGTPVLGLNDNDRFQVKSQTIHIHPGDKNIELAFSSLNYVFSSKMQYAYKLEGIDDDWVYTDASRPYAFYNHLPKGNYTFLLKTTDSNGLWSKETAMINIYKSPAFYESWWAYLLYSFVVVVLVYSVYNRARNRIRLRQELQIAQIEKEKGEELTQIKLRYFTNISHDFLTPLTIINCLIDDVEMSYKNKVPQFAIMRANIDRLKRLLRQIIDFRKIESGNMKLKITQGDISQFIKDICLSNFEPLMSKKQINFSFNTVAEQIPAYFDYDKVDKIIFNLLSNAYKYTPEYGEIKVELEQYHAEFHNYVKITISDTGIGIAPENLENIFMRFYTDKRGGLTDTNGIGLSLTKELLNLHRGSINVESQLNKGTIFTVRIPIDSMSYQETEINISNPIIDDNIITSEKDIYSDVRISLSEIEKEDIQLLLVEDNEELLYLMYHILSKRYDVIIAKNGLEALGAINKNEIDILISDVMMPEMDGLELSRTLKSNIETSHIPIILLTAKNSNEDRIECYNAGADAYISKPFDLKVLEARISNFIQNRKNKQREFKTDVVLDTSTLETSNIDKEHLDKIIQIIQENISESSFDVNMLAEKLLVSNSSLYRKVKGMTGLSPVEFIRNIRLKYASQMLKEGTRTISEIAYASGFSNPKYFSTCFKEEFNMTPTEYQKMNHIE
ncbi:two-component regulator propeller domain-containing protein [Dysgonomonas sp. GY75]|uniref:two-component regulator propeller domain-containing protein n=1 Tax=Dysgonomonas sp. GY75 TaxID=2780419 RepID=UPI00293BF9C0|nr:two-component regulator propeller domain-containing protein [Dysgonomonas sp. GY75]